MPQVIEARSGNRNAGLFLRKAVLSEKWAAHSCEIFIQDPKMTFEQFHSSLVSAIVTMQETENAKSRACAETSDISYVDEVDDAGQKAAQAIWYGGHYTGPYNRSRFRRRGSGRVPAGFERGRGVRFRSGYGRGGTESTGKFRTNRICWKCGQRGHISPQCTLDGTIRDAVRARMNEGGSNTYDLVDTLFSLAEEFDTTLDDINHEDVICEDGSPEGKEIVMPGGPNESPKAEEAQQTLFQEPSM